jgi:hypothetical protein
VKTECGARDRRGGEDLEELYQSDLRLALLAPDLVEAVLVGRVDQRVVLERLERPLPVGWEEQRHAWDLSLAAPPGGCL